MSKGPIKNTAASIHQRLLNVSRISGRSFNDLVVYYSGLRCDGAVVVW